MATINIQDRVLAADGSPVSVGCTVTAYGINGDGTLGAQIGSAQTPDSNGVYSFALSTGTYSTFAVKIVAGTDVRWRYPDVRLMVEEIAGPNGVAPLPTGSVTTALMATGAATDTIVGNRTVNQTLAGGASTGTLSQLLSWIGKALKAISGEANWYTAPTTGTLQQKVRNGGNVPRITSANSRGSASEAEEVKIVTSGVDKGLWQYTNGNWVEIANTEGSGGSSSGAYGFRYVNVGSTTIAADQAEDTLTLVAGSGVTLTPSSSGDSVTIAASSGGGGSGTANAVATSQPSSARTFSTSTYADIDAVNSDSDSTGGEYLITATVDVEALSANTQFVVALLIGGVADAQQMVFTTTSAGDRTTMTGHWIETLPSGSTTLLIRGKVDSGSARVASGSTRISAIKLN